jgi:hypothetical protein
VNVFKARSYQGTPPNANAALLPFVATLSDGTTRVFNAAAWQSAAKTSAAWSDAAWSDAAWASAAWSDAAWSDAAWSDAAWADNAGDDAGDTAEVGSSQADALIAAFGITDPNCDPTLTDCTATTVTTVTP